MSRQNEEIDKIDKSIGKKLHSLRIAMGLSRQQLGNLIGVTHQQCQKYEKGTNRLSVGRLALIAKALEKPISYFYEDIDKPTEDINMHHQTMCIQVSRNFMEIKNSNIQEAINMLVKTLAK